MLESVGIMQESHRPTRPWRRALLGILAVLDGLQLATCNLRARRDATEH